MKLFLCRNKPILECLGSDCRVEDLADGGPGVGGSLGAGVELGGDLDELGAEEAEFDLDLAEGGGYVLEFAAQGDAFGPVGADAEGGGLGEEDFCEFLAFVFVAEDGEDEAWAVFFHLRRGEEDVESAVLEEALHGSTGELGAEVVEVGLDLEDGVGRGGFGGGAKDEAKGVGAGRSVAGAESVAGRLDLHGWHGAEAGGELGENGGAGGRDKLGGLFRLAERDASEDFESGGRGERKSAMCAINPA